MEELKTMYEETRHEGKKNSNAVTYLVAGLMIFLLLFSAVQSFQIGTIEEKAINGNFAVQGRVSSAGSSAAAAPKTAAPQMVGGC